MIDLPLCARMNDNIKGDECAENIPPPMRWLPGASTELQREPGNTSNEEQQVRKKSNTLLMIQWPLLMGFIRYWKPTDLHITCRFLSFIL